MVLVTLTARRSDRRLSVALAPVCTPWRPRPVLYRKRSVDRDLPSKSTTKIPQSASILSAEDDFIFWQKRNNEILAVASHGDLSFVLHGRSISAGVCGVRRSQYHPQYCVAAASTDSLLSWHSIGS